MKAITLATCALAAAAVFAGPALAEDEKPAAPTEAQRLGLDRLGKIFDGPPTGRGVVVAHVEARQGEGYAPHTRRFEGVTIETLAGPTGISGHANATAKVIYGPRGLAPGVSRVHAYDRDGWADLVLRVGQDRAPDAGGADLSTHSWISHDTHAYGKQVLDRVDDLVDRGGHVVVAGVNNGDTPVPALLGSAYNAIAVGQYSGNNSRGYTTALVAGRCKPDLVATRGLTSFSTPAAAAMVARLIELARRGDRPHADRPQTIKAALLAGAEKPEGWSPEDGRPLDERFGAGRLRIDQSARIVAAPAEAGPGRIERASGWRFYEKLAPRSSVSDEIDLTRPVAEASVALVWHRRVQPADAPAEAWREPRPRLAELRLKLLAIDEAGQVRQIAASGNGRDNVAHLYLENLTPGRYRLVVERADALGEPWDAALAWRLEPTAAGAGPEPGEGR